ncbi:MAG: phosphatase PAP2 family protein [Candidatus Methylomirabilia bacterium]
MNDARDSLLPVDFRRHLLIALLFAGMVAVCYHLVDRPAALWARGLDPALVAVFKRITYLGSSTPYLAVLAVLYPALRFSLRRQEAAKRALFVLAAIVVSGLTVDLLKPLVARWRPKAFFAEASQFGFAFFKTGYEHNSFPSGHATTALALACALTLLYPRFRVLWFGAGVLVAASRVIVGAHYPGDVLAGAWFGVVITLALSRTAWFRVALGEPGDASRKFAQPKPGDV